MSKLTGYISSQTSQSSFQLLIDNVNRPKRNSNQFPDPNNIHKYRVDQSGTIIKYQPKQEPKSQVQDDRSNISNVKCKKIKLYEPKTDHYSNSGKKAYHYLIQKDIKELQAHLKVGNLSYPQLASMFKVSLSSINRFVRQFKQYGKIIPRIRKPKQMMATQQEKRRLLVEIKNILRKNQKIGVRQLQDQLQQIFGKIFTQQQIRQRINQIRLE